MLLQSTLLISIAAGICTKDMLGQVPDGTRIARVMPNTPCVVGEMAAGYCVAAARGLPSHKAATMLASDRALVHHLLSACGTAVETDERLMDAVTGVSGSGPVRSAAIYFFQRHNDGTIACNWSVFKIAVGRLVAILLLSVQAYVFQFIEAMSDGGVRAGLPRQVATRLAAQTVLGAAKMVLETGEHPGVLKDQVTSPGGTTIAAVHQLEVGGMRGSVMNAVLAAAQKSKELGAK